MMPDWTLRDSRTTRSGFALVFEIDAENACECGRVPTSLTIELSPAQAECMRDALTRAVEARVIA